jgi:signal peptidase I
MMQVLGQFLLILFLAFGVVFAIRSYIAQPFIVSGPSMESALTSGDYLIIDRLTYRFAKPQRGDVVVFHYPLDTSTYLIKRIVGLPGDVIAIRNGEVLLLGGPGETNERLNEPYVSKSWHDDLPATTLSPQEYFLMGDNRTSSSDSRVWGPLDGDYIVGRAVARLFPFSKMSLFPADYSL